MPTDVSIAKFSNQLEDAGWLGLSAASIVSIVGLAEGTPGAYSSTGGGFVWTKTLDTGAGEQRFNFGIGELVVSGGLLTSTLGVALAGGKPSHISVLVTYFAGGQAETDQQGLYLELDRRHCVLADKVKDPAGQTIGYTNDNQTVRLPLPSVSLEFNFTLGEGNQIVSSVNFYDAVHGLARAASGLIELSLPDKVIVFPSLAGIGFTIDQLFLDLSATEATGFKAAFPEAYHPSWKGIGAQEISLLIPVDKEDNEFVVAGITGFLLDFEGNYSFKASLDYVNDDAGALLRRLRGEVEFRSSELITSELSAVFDLKQSSDKLYRNADEASAASSANGNLSGNARTLSTEGRTATDARTGATSLSGFIECSIGFLRHDLSDGRQAWGIEIAAERVAVDGATSIATVEGMPARVLFWLAGAGFGTFLTVKGFKDGEDGTAAGGVGLLTLIAFDVMSEAAGATSVLPVLQSLSVNRLGYRYITLARDETTVEEYHEVVLDWQIKLAVEGALLQMLTAIASLGFTALTDTGDLFGESLDAIRVKGPLELEFANLYLRFKKSATGVEFMPELTEEFRRLFVEPDLKVTAKALPEIQVAAASGDSDTPKPIVGAKFVTKEETTKAYGLSILLKGDGNSKVQAPVAEVGVGFYFYPDFSVEFVSQLATTPRFVFLIPGVVYAEGVLDLNKPMPAFAGTQNRVSVELGVINTQVSAGAGMNEEDMEKLFELTNYNYQFSGEFVWGEAASPDPHGSLGMYDFLFVEFAYVGKSPLFVIGPVGIYGLGGLFGRNIAPGSSDGTALGIADWILGSGSGAFDNVRNWPPAGPTNATWHPDRIFEDDKDRFAVGLYVKAGDVTSSGEAVSVEAILMVGFPEFWIALAGIATIKPVNAKITVVIVYDHPSRSFVIKAILTFKVDEDGKLIEMKVPFTLGTIGTPSRQFTYLGHYRDDEGGPVEAKLFQIYSIKCYYVIDTDDLTEFGLIPDDAFERPTIPGPAFGQGGLWQFGPKQFGPSFLHVKILVALGYNLAISFNPFLVFGELFVLGYLKVKVFIFSFKLGLAARLYGLATKGLYRFAGELRVTLDLPWPFPNVEESFDFYLEGGDGSALIDEPAMEVTAAGLYRLESRSVELVPGELPRLPIDGIIALQFNKPIHELITAVDAADPHTALTVHSPADAPTLDKPVEVTTTEFFGESYQIVYKHYIDRISLRAAGTLVTEQAASWDVPGISGDPAATDVQPRHALYLNTLQPPELQFSHEALGRFQALQLAAGHVSPCQRPVRVCIIDKSRAANNPAVDESATLYAADFPSAAGTTAVREVMVAPALSLYALTVRNIHRMGWVDVNELRLPYVSRIDPPDCNIAQLYFRLKTLPEDRYIKGYYLTLRVKLLGRTEPLPFIVYFVRADGTDCPFKGVIAPITPEQFGIDDVPGDGLEVNHELLSATLEITACERGDLSLRVDLTASDYGHLIDHILVEGPLLLLDPGQLSGFSSPSPLAHARTHVVDRSTHDNAAWVYMMRLTQAMELRLVQLCFRQDYGERAQWERTCIAGCAPGGGSLPPDESLQAIWDGQLLEPDTEYEVTYRLHAYGSTQIVGREEDNVPSQEKDFVFDSTDTAGSTIRTVRFRTEAAPSQSVAAYVAFTFPGPDMQPLYPDTVVPLISLKNRGLIDKIFEKHYGPGTLQTRVVDIDGNEIPKQLTTFLELGSAPTDEALEALAAACLPNAQGLTHLQLQVWQKELETNTPYALQLVNTHPAEDRIEQNVSFVTSRFADLQEHVAHTAGLFAAAIHIPVLDHAGAEATLAAAVGGALSGALPTHDHLVERIYRELLGEDTGRLALRYGSAGTDFAAYLVGRDMLGNLHTWGAVIELGEPILGKEGVTVTNLTAGMGGHTDKGLYFIGTGAQRGLVVRDFSASRLLLLHTPDGGVFTGLPPSSELSLQFSGEASLRTAIERYVARTYATLTAAEQSNHVATAMTAVSAIVDPGSNTATVDLVIPSAA